MFLIGYLSCLTYKLWSNKATELIGSLADGSEIMLNHLSLSEVGLGYCRGSVCKRRWMGSFVLVSCLKFHFSSQHVTSSFFPSCYYNLFELKQMCDQQVWDQPAGILAFIRIIRVMRIFRCLQDMEDLHGGKEIAQALSLLLPLLFSTSGAVASVLPYHWVEHCHLSGLWNIKWELNMSRLNQVEQLAAVLVLNITGV